MDAYLDIETTGLSPEYCEITVVGIHLVGKHVTRTVQLVGGEANLEGILNTLRNVDIIYTYNGSRFDLPFIDRRLGVHLAGLCPHRDLMYDCWRNNLYGGLKKVERQLGIIRHLPDINGFEAVRLWWRYVNDYDETALATLLEYNREDIVNLKILRDKLITT
jgi:uncharacterized protein YprB with RNaseH-like and TPR domain